MEQGQDLEQQELLTQVEVAVVVVKLLVLVVLGQAVMAVAE
jgi:hypothetical protein